MGYAFGVNRTHLISIPEVLYCSSWGLGDQAMSRTSILAIFASAGLVFSGTITADSIAFARAIQSDDASMLQRFATQYPDSAHRDDAIKLAARDGCKVNWDNGDCGEPFQPGNGGTPAVRAAPPPPDVVEYEK
jgi:hypothetical protein